MAAMLSVSCTSIKHISGMKDETTIPVAKVIRTPVEMKIHTVGELRPSRTAMITAPPVGGVLQIVKIMDLGTRVQEGDIVVAFDPSEQEYNLEQSRSQLDEAEQQIRKMKADQAVRVAEEQVSLLRARYAVERAVLVVEGNDLLSAIEARKNVIALEEARRRLQQLERDVESRAASDAADLEVQNVARNRAAGGIQTAQRLIDSMTCRATISGIVVLSQNIESLASASGGGGITISSETDIPRYRQGDRAYSGDMIAQIQSLDQMEISAKVLETDRANIKSGQDVEVRMNSNPLKTYRGILKSIADTSMNASTNMDYLETMSTRSFATIFEVHAGGTFLYPGSTAEIVIPGMDTTEVLSIPRQALRQKAGKTFVYVRNQDDWQEHEVRVLYLTESRAVIDDVAEGTEVALVDPERRKSKSSAKGNPNDFISS